jgi:hypothetical protein
VRLHFKPATGMEASLEGVMASSWAGRYVLLLPTLIEGEDRSVSLKDKAGVLKENVLFWEQLS